MASPTKMPSAASYLASVHAMTQDLKAAWTALSETFCINTAENFVNAFRLHFADADAGDVPRAYQISVFLEGDVDPKDPPQHTLILLDHRTRLALAHHLPSFVGTRLLDSDEKAAPQVKLSEKTKSEWYVYQSWVRTAYPSLHTLDETVAQQILRHPAISLKDAWHVLVPVHHYDESIDPQLTKIRPLTK